MKRTRLQFESLEDRCLMSANAMLVGSEVVVTGTAQDDLIAMEDTMVITGVQYVPSSGTLGGRWEFVTEPGVRVSISKNNGTLSIPQMFSFAESDFSQIRVNALDGDDYVINNTGYRSIMYGGNGHDVLIGGSDVDWLFGDVGKDRLFGRDGYYNYMRGGADDDVLVGGGQRNYMYGESGRDHLWGGAGDDYLNGGADNDRLDGGSGRDRIDGGSGFDTGIWDAFDTSRQNVERWLIPFMAGSAPDGLEAPELPDPDCPVC